MILNQFVEAMLVGDATSDHLILIRDWLREWGFHSEIYAQHCQAALRDQVRPFSEYERQSEEKAVIYHHGIGSTVADRLADVGLPLILIYHNITPSRFFARSNEAMMNQLQKGRRQLRTLKANTLLALGDSAFNEAELRDVGYSPTGVLPIVLNEAEYACEVDRELYAGARQDRPLLLFVGRVTPSKRQDDLIKLIFFLRRISPRARLLLVGSLDAEGYGEWLLTLARSMALDPEAVTITGHVTQQEMVTYYRAADLYVSMSEHEGFGKPLLESMYFDLPVLAYAAAAVPFTMGGAGVLCHHKHFEALAELAHFLISDQALRQRIIRDQRRRMQSFLAPQVKDDFKNLLVSAGMMN